MKKSKFILQFVAMLLALTIFIPSMSWALDDKTGQAKIFVYVEGIEGSSTDYSHRGWIDAIGFGGGITIPNSSMASAGGAWSSERPEHSPISILKGLDRATVGLYVEAARGGYIKNVIIEVVVNDQVIFIYTLTGVMVTKIRSDMERDKVIGAVETVEFDYGEIRWEYNDNMGRTIQGEWSVVENKGG